MHVDEFVCKYSHSLFSCCSYANELLCGKARGPSSLLQSRDLTVVTVEAGTPSPTPMRRFYIASSCNSEVGLARFPVHLQYLREVMRLCSCLNRDFTVILFAFCNFVCLPVFQRLPTPFPFCRHFTLFWVMLCGFDSVSWISITTCFALLVCCICLFLSPWEQRLFVWPEICNLDSARELHKQFDKQSHLTVLDSP